VSRYYRDKKGYYYIDRDGNYYRYTNGYLPPKVDIDELPRRLYRKCFCPSQKQTMRDVVPQEFENFHLSFDCFVKEHSPPIYEIVSLDTRVSAITKMSNMSIWMNSMPSLLPSGCFFINNNFS